MSRYKQPYTLYKRGKYWYYRTYDNLGIRTAGKSTGQTSKTAAKNYCEKLYLSNNLFNSEVKFIDYSYHFFDADSLYFTARAKKPTVTTINQYQHHYHKNILPYFQDCKLCDINYTMLLQYQRYLTNQGFSQSTTRTIMIILKQILNHAYKDQIISKNPFDFLTISTATQNARDAFTFEEVKYIYDHISADFKNSVLLLALTGMRVSELIGLDPADVKLHKDGFHYIDIQRQNYYGKILAPKQDSFRCVPVIEELASMVEPHIHYYKNLMYDEINKVIKNFDNYESRKLSLHSFRHFFVTAAKAANISDIKVEFLAGHKLKGVAKTYTNFKVDDLTEIIAWQQDLYKKLV